MTSKYAPIHAKSPHLWHGGDYNPDQWTPDIWSEDMRLMKLANVNVVSVGIFSWTALEPEEGRFEFGWLDRIMDMLAENGVCAVLATPSGARPAWMSQKYPEVLRVRPDGNRNRHGLRHNHCMTSPVYREKVHIINTRLAERYKDHPALVLWHLSNEYGGMCHCNLCAAAFRDWLKNKYRTLDALNHAWWTAFWSHTFTDWSQIEPPSPIGEPALHGLNLDWSRFVTDQTVDFMRHEIAALRVFTPDVPVTTNFMGTYPVINYWKFAPHLDVISWDSYPQWHQDIPDSERGANVAFVHDINRCLKGGKPFMLMESVPSTTNWFPRAKLKRPGMHLLSSLQAVAHGSDTVMYFQWRKGRGGPEKFHGAVVDHVGHEHTRVFRDVAEVGAVLQKLDAVVGTTTRPQVGLIYDWENKWALDGAEGPMRGEKGYLETCLNHYRAFWHRGIPVDVIDMEQDFSRYTLLVAPMLYMVRPGVAERIRAFVEAGGTFVTTYWSGIVDENDLCFLGGFPGPLRPVLGIWAEEIDALPPQEENSLVPTQTNGLGLTGVYGVRDLCDLIHAETAEVLAVYRSDFYAGRPALTVNAYGKGRAYYIASRNEQRFQDDFYRRLCAEIGVRPVLDSELPHSVNVHSRSDGAHEFIFVMNFSPDETMLDLDNHPYTDMLTGESVSGRLSLGAFGLRVLSRPAR